MSFIDPHSDIIDPIRAMFGPGDVNERMNNALKELLSPLDPSLVTSRVVDTWYNKRSDTGATVYDEQANTSTKLKQASNYVGDVFVPGAIKSWARGKDYMEQGKYDKATLEAAASFSGNRLMDIDVGRSFKYMSLDRQKQMNDAASSIAKRFATSKENQSIEDMVAAYNEFDRNREVIMGRWHRETMDAISLGVPMGDAISTIGNAGSNTMAAKVMSNIYTPYVPGADTMALIYKQPDGPKRVAALSAAIEARAQELEEKRKHG